MAQSLDMTLADCGIGADTALHDADGREARGFLPGG